MEKSNKSIPADKEATSAAITRPALALQMEDVADLHTVLRGYYLRQIKSLKKRKDRKLARRLLEDHLILPKSRQRTSKDAAYIKEILGIEPGLLARLEDSRLIRRMHKTGTNPIYEVSHDTLVEPILAEKRNREAVVQFIRKTWKYAALFLLIWFLFGMWLENSLEILPDIPRNPQTQQLTLEERTLREQMAFTLQLPPVAIPKGMEYPDTLAIRMPLRLLPLPRTGPNRGMGQAYPDTIAINLTSPITVPMDTGNGAVVYHPFSNVIVPLAYSGGDLSDPEVNRTYAKLSGNLRITKAGTSNEGNAGASEDSPSRYNVPLERPLEIDLGETVVQARTSTRSVPVSATFQLTDLFENEVDKSNVRSTIGDRSVQLNYTVRVRPAPAPPPTTKTVKPKLRGIEVQYSDGSSRFIPGAEIPGGETLHTVAKGETLYSIARQYGVTGPDGSISVEPIKELNGLQGNAIKVGQTLLIPAG